MKNQNSTLYLVDEFGLDAQIEIRLVLSSYNKYILQYRVKNTKNSFLSKIKNFLNNIYTWQTVKIPLHCENWQSKDSIDRFQISNSSDTGYLYNIMSFDIEELYSKNGVFTKSWQHEIFNKYQKLGDLPEYQPDVIELVRTLDQRDLGKLPAMIYLN